MNRDRGSNVRRLRRHNAHRVPASGVSSCMEPRAPHEHQRSTVNSPPAEDDDDESVESFTALAQTSNRVVANERDDGLNK